MSEETSEILRLKSLLIAEGICPAKGYDKKHQFQDVAGNQMCSGCGYVMPSNGCKICGRATFGPRCAKCFGK